MLTIPLLARVHGLSPEIDDEGEHFRTRVHIPDDEAITALIDAQDPDDVGIILAELLSHMSGNFTLEACLQRDADIEDESLNGIPLLLLWMVLFFVEEINELLLEAILELDVLVSGTLQHFRLLEGDVDRYVFRKTIQDIDDLLRLIPSTDDPTLLYGITVIVRHISHNDDRAEFRGYILDLELQDTVRWCQDIFDGKQLTREFANGCAGHLQNVVSVREIA